jgi:organic radical activating enzyme
LRFGGGLKVKLLESLAQGLPFVATPLAVDGMHYPAELNAYLAQDARTFAEKTVRLLTDRRARDRLSTKMKACFLENYSNEVVSEAETRLYDALADGGGCFSVSEPLAKKRVSSVIAAWDLLLRCNYRCPYCFNHGRWEQLERHNKPYSSGQWLAFWKKIHERYGQISIIIAGGEPTVFDGFFGLLKQLVVLHKVELCTNLSWDVAPFADTFSYEDVKLHPSYHPFCADIKPFIKKIKFLQARGWDLGPVIVAYPPLLPKIEDFKLSFAHEGIGIFVQPFVGTFKGNEYPGAYSAEEIRFLKRYVNGDLTRPQLESLNPFGMSCAAGKDYFRVHPDGLIFRCAGSHEVIGSIEDADFSLRVSATPCKANFCVCNNESVYLQKESGV